MHTNPTEQAEVLELYKKWQHAYLNGDTATYGLYLADDYHFIGSTDNEEFLNRDETIQFFAATADQLSGKTDIRHNTITIEFFEGLYFITEVLDGYFLSEGNWVFYSRFRFSSVLQKKPAGWRFIYQHFSTPDGKADEGQTIGYENVSEENRILKEAIRRRTAELEHKNRELEIEASLEKVRTVAVGMQESKQLADVVGVMYRELHALKFANVACELILCNQDTEQLQYWSAITLQTHAPQSYHVPRTAHSFFEKQWQAWMEGRERLDITLGGKEKKEWGDLILEKTEFSQYPEEIKMLIRQRDTDVFTHACFRYGLLEAVGDHALSAEEFTVLRKFADVFEQAYTRFLDLQMVEAQAREAQVEAALERVRSRTMGMQKSEELKDVIHVVNEQFVHLQIKVDHAGFILDYKERDDMHIWLADPNDVPFQITIPYFDSPHWNSFLEAKEKGLNFFSNHLDFQEKNKFYTDLLALFPVAEDAKNYYLTCPGLAISTVLLDDIGLYIENFSGIPYTEAENAILMRVGKVFEQAYTRFMDLQKAEAQARESEVELSLERIRAQAMAMKESADLLDIVVIMRHEFLRLGHEAHYFWHMRWLANTYEKAMTSGDGTRIGMVMELPRGFHEDQRMLDWEKTKEPIGIFTYDADGAIDYVDKMIRTGRFDLVDHNAPGPDDIRHIGGLTFVMARTTHGEIGYSLPGIILKIPDADLKTLARFAGVFDLAYKRFEDLKTSEQQTRQAQIELALERVRARTMAMRSSDELAEVSYVLNKQVVELGIPTRGCAFNIYGEHESTEWFSNLEGTLPAYKTPRENVFLKYYEAGQRGETLLIEEFDNERIKQHYDYLHTLHLLEDDEEEVAKIRNAMPDAQVDHVAYFKYGYLLFITLAPAPEAHDVFKRFAKEFEQTYTRFLDLQKAEAQAREAQIEAALERVRSRTMGMQRSDELQEAAMLLFQQVVTLGVPAFGTGFNIWDEDRKYATAWMAGIDRLQPPFKTSSAEDIFLRIHQAAERGETLFIEEQGGESLKAHYDYMASIPVFKEIAEKMASAGQSFPSFQIMHCAFFSLGYLMFITFEPVPKAYDIFKRFAKVFEQTYTRFLDLQKAEAQARDAQIEAALERVRSRTMGMQKSTELNQVAFVLFEQIRLLGGRLWGTGFVLCNAQEDFDEFWFANEMGVMPPVSIPNTDDDVHKAMLQGWKQNEDYLLIEKDGDELASHYQYLYSLPQIKAFFDPMLAAGFTFPTWQQWHTAYFSKGYLLIITTEPYTEPYIFKRFANVFDQTYTRFLDLQKAEAQAREAQVEAALERVRSRAMAMQKSRELGEVVHELRNQMGLLGQKDLETCVIQLYEESPDYIHAWAGIRAPESGESILAANAIVPKKGLRIMEEALDAYYANRQDYVLVNEGEKLTQWFSFLEKASPESYAKLVESVEGDPGALTAYWSFADFEGGSLLMVTRDKPAEYTRSMLRRFSNVFGLAYRRFTDIKQAEAQAREAQIEVAVERVRAKALAMHQSEEIMGVLRTLWQELASLQIPGVVATTIYLKQDNGQIRFWDLTTLEGTEEDAHVMDKYMRLEDCPDFLWFQRMFRSDEKYMMVEQDQDELKRSVAWIREFINEDVAMSMSAYFDEINSWHLWHPRILLEKGIMNIDFVDTPPAETEAILTKMGAAFDLAYKRFTDLVKAEARAREAQIEAALERVRSKTMAMHNSHEVGESVATLFEELVGLGVLTPEDRCGIGIMLPNHQMEAWTAAKTTDGKAELTIGFLDMTLHPLLTSAYQGWVDKKEINQFVLEGEDRIRYYEAMLRQPNYKIKRDHYTGSIRIIHNDFYFKEGCLYVFSERELPPSSLVVYTRFAAVFGQTYRRYLDLQKAEAQAREAQIEAALESVRSKAMAMRTSEDIAETTAASFAELKKLGISSFRSGVGILTKGSRMAQVFADTRAGDGQTRALSTMRSMDEHPALQQQYTAWEKQEDYEQFLSGDELITYYSHPFFQKSNIDLQKKSGNKQECGYYFAFPDGLFYAWSHQPYSEDEKNILRRFRNIISLTFRRYLDLQKAEAQAREATKQASLDRVRAVIASMRSTEDLELITPLIFKELTILGIPFIRCGIFIIHEDRQIIDAYLSSPSGTSLGVLHLPFHASELTIQTVEAWRNGKVHRQHWSQADFIAWTKQMMDQHQIESSRTYQGADAAPESLDLHFVPFTQGMLYVGSLQALGDQDIELALALAGSFSIAYARYEDFVKLETAKANIESTLTELRATQTQLIQSEKMASLGELTAGIAHEIQNPLNFVNNFSEINTELSAEILEAAEKGDLEEVKAIAADIRNNQEKIAEHGKRADSIVKSMLQHSRSSSGAKEPTDLNKLADEYLRLAYHGFRAKDKNFNTNIKSDLAPDLPIVPVMTQDLGRVLLNLFNNAFYAVNTRNKTAGEGYAPEVCVSSRSNNGNVFITISDNGLGIPEHIREKIFQPFFTTKPTGEGTGLGLSLSYDIIKAAGGAISVDSEEGKGTSFTIILPNTQQ